MEAAEELAEEAYGNGNDSEWVEPRLAAIRSALSLLRSALEEGEETVGLMCGGADGVPAGTAGREAVLQEAWRAIDARIARGPLPGNGTDKTAERNGMVLACNTSARRVSRPMACHALRISRKLPKPPRLVS